MKRYLIAGLMLSLFLLSCGPSDKEGITISWWQFWTDTTIKPVIEEIVADFEKSHPGVTIKLVDLTWADGHDKIAIAFSAGSGPDIVELGSDWIAEFSSSGHLADITAEVMDVHNDYLMWDPTMYQDKIYAFPWILGTRVLYTNTELLNRAGFESDFVPSSWVDLLEASGKINDLSGDIYGFGSNSAERHRLYKKFLPFFWANGASIFSEDGQDCNIDSPEAVTALEYYLDLCRTGLTDTQRRLEDSFLEGRIGFVISGDWLLKRMAREKPEMAFATQVIPGPNGLSSSASFAGGEYLAINSTSSNKKQALEFIRHLCSRQNQLRFCLQNRTANPASKGAASDATFLAQPHFDTFINQMKTARMPPVHPRWVYIEDRLEKAVEAALYEVKSPQEALREAAVEIRELMGQ